MAGVNPVVAGLACRCPNCGEGPLFKGFLSVADRCEACGFDLPKADSGRRPGRSSSSLIVKLPGGLQAMVFTGDLALPPTGLVHLVHVAAAGRDLHTSPLLRPFKAVLVALQFHHKASRPAARHV